jgi:hypothetical protein
MSIYIGENEFARKFQNIHDQSRSRQGIGLKIWNGWLKHSFLKKINFIS